MPLGTFFPSPQNKSRLQLSLPIFAPPVLSFLAIRASVKPTGAGDDSLPPQRRGKPFAHLLKDGLGAVRGSNNELRIRAILVHSRHSGLANRERGKDKESIPKPCGGEMNK